MKRYVFVTGASTGLGRATAIEFARAGYTVLAGVRRSEDGQALQESVPGIVPILIELADREAIEAAIDRVEVHVGTVGLAALVNNAGYTFYAPVEYS